MRSTLLLGAGLAAVVGWSAYGGNLAQRLREVPGVGNFRCSVASITDGDTLRCVETDATGRQIRVRLSGISARERDRSCGVGHPCPPASAEEAAAALDRLASGQTLSCQANGTTYGRVAAFCTNAAGADLSCAMIESGTAARWDRFMAGHRC